MNRLITLRAAGDLGAGVTERYIVNMRGASAVVLNALATDGNQLSANPLVEWDALDGRNGWQSVPAGIITEDGDALGVITLNNSVAPSTVAAGRKRVYRMTGATWDSFPANNFRFVFINGGAIITGFEVLAMVLPAGSPAFG